MLSKEQLDKRILVQEHFAKEHLPHELTKAQIEQLNDEIIAELKARDACLVAHYYCDPLVQAIAEKSGGCVADSLEMARFGAKHSASTLVVAGVRFMGETAKILSPDKRILMPTLEATCSLDLGCPVDDFSAFCDQHPDREVVVYANTSAAVKARADWVVTSSIAVQVIEHLAEQDKKIIWAPDKHLGTYVQKETGADMLLWDGACIVHEEFKAKGLLDLKQVYAVQVIEHLAEQDKKIIWAPDKHLGTYVQKRLVQICCSGMGPASFTRSSKPKVCWILNRSTQTRQFWSIPSRPMR